MVHLLLKPQDDLGLDLGAQQMCDFFGKDGAAMGTEWLEAVEVQDDARMSRRGFLGIEMEFDLFQPEACPADHVFNIPRMEGPRREEALARFEG
jgi:hypothetical protein